MKYSRTSDGKSILISVTFSISSVDMIITHMTAVYKYTLGSDVLIIMYTADGTVGMDCQLVNKQSKLQNLKYPTS